MSVVPPRRRETAFTAVALKWGRFAHCDPDSGPDSRDTNAQCHLRRLWRQFPSRSPDR
eukprot:CAMPEP_0206322356 /NCGR_PEP_ID=MMETSP0106_2-20121207/19378_1 /ASSEMBLY_ACC=CAM_ASM_000206 /TAXON_ID=81532 /ORGANISM="Acanthoeca-like sp., Strain 10tr" /LENGTH=57 /DNA_ID=CAMNT_0053754515 /DNA_START=281 /DNA_END=451 /DNA_ORIENTATION=+